MASANDGDRATAGILRLLLGMAAAAAPPPELARVGGGVVVVQQVIIDATDGDVFSGGIGGGVPPASKAAIAALKEVNAGADGQEEGGGSLGECAICLDGVESVAKEMPCGHRFHGECLERWLGVHGSCPVCRHELPPAKEEVSPAAAEGGGEARRPRGFVVRSYVLVGGEPEQQQQREEREEPWNIRIEDVD